VSAATHPGLESPRPPAHARRVTRSADLLVVGSSFAGALAAMIARRAGRRVLLLERGRHPRFAIGESSTPVANLLLEELARAHDLPRLLPLTKWGAWQAAYPHLACGLKRGFSFYHHLLGRPWRATPDRAHELLVAASPGDAIADTHWFRPHFDEFFVREAQALGVEYLDEMRLAEFAETADGVAVRGTRHGRPVSFHGARLLDASGPRGFLHRALGATETGFDNYPGTQALYAHFTGVARWADRHPPAGTPPFPPDDAALHHVFPGGWMWVLRFNHGVTSAGVAVHDALAAELNLAEGAPAWARLLARLPSVREQFAAAAPVTAFTHAPRLAFQSGLAAGPRWALLPGAVGFLDPLLSTGFPLTLLGVQRLAPWLTGHADAPASLAGYAAETRADLAAAAALLAALHGALDCFDTFRELVRLYLAAASYTETMRRLGRPERAPGFLLRGDAEISRRFARCRELAARRDPALPAAVREAIAPVNVAGLDDPARRHWYPCAARDLLAAGPRLGVAEAELRAMLRRAGFTAE
jgi:tetracycline 7-halogenase / FADH2 O2-dependent halogenase